MLLKNDEKPIRIEHVNINNVSKVISKYCPFNKFKPQVIIVSNPGSNSKFILNNDLYLEESSFGALGIFLKKED